MSTPLNEADRYRQCMVCLLERSNRLLAKETAASGLLVIDVIRKHFWFTEAYCDGRYVCMFCWRPTEYFHMFYKEIEQLHYVKRIEQSQYVKLETIKPDEVEQTGEDITFPPPSALDTSDWEREERIENINEVYVKDSESDTQLDTSNGIDRSASEEESDADSEVPLSNKLVHLSESEKQFKCDKCSKGFGNEGLLASHQEGHINLEKKNITCSDCNICFPSVLTLHEHQSMHHPAHNGVHVTSGYRSRRTAVEIAEQNAVIARYCTLSCQQCEFIASDFADLKQHGFEKHGQRTVQVLCCDQPYSNRLRLYEHCLQHDDPDRFRCPLCGKRYVSSLGLKHHQMVLHTPAAERPFCCDFCDETFAKPYLASSICEICAKGFNNRSLLEKHRLTHSAEGKTQLKHQCERCKKWLRNKKCYQQHRKRCHDNSGPVKCKFCGRESVNSVALEDHVRLHHAERPEHACTHCEKRFKTALRLREHEATHTGTTLYRCPWCPRTFACGSNMYRHKKAKHPEEWAAGVQKRFGER